MVMPARYTRSDSNPPTLVLVSATSTIASGQLQFVPDTHPSGQGNEQERAAAAAIGYQVILGALDGYLPLSPSHTHQRLHDESND